MNGSKSITFAFLFIFCSTFTFSVRSEDELIITNEMKSAEVDFLLGYQDFLNNKYELAADKFYSVILDKPSSNILNRSFLYLSLSQFKLGNKTDASFNASYVDNEKLDSKDKLLFQRLISSLDNLYTQALIKRKKIESITMDFFSWS